MSTKTVKLAYKEIYNKLANCINKCIRKTKFPNELEAAHTTPTFTKEHSLDKETCNLILNINRI